MINQWTPALEELKSKIDEHGRKVLLSQLIGRFQQIAIWTFGEDGENRPSVWPTLKRGYANEYHGGDDTPTLLLSDEKHSLASSGPHLIDSFQISLSSEQASITNISPYADVHQFGLGAVPARPFYPLDEDGQLTPYAEQELNQVVVSYFEGE